MYGNGYHGTSVKDITDAAGIPKGSFYNYFEDKEHYAVDALDYYINVMRKPQMEMFDNKDLNPIERILSYFRDRIEQLENKGLRYGCLAGNLIEEMGDNSIIISEAADKVDKIVLNNIIKNLEEARELNLIKTKSDLNILASFIVSSWQGSMLRMKLKNNKITLDEFIIVLEDKLINLQSK